jgi:hypothetical protein
LHVPFAGLFSHPLTLLSHRLDYVLKKSKKSTGYLRWIARDRKHSHFHLVSDYQRNRVEGEGRPKRQGCWSLRE